MQTVILGRFMAKFVIQDDGCWQWTAATNGAGYGRFHDPTIGKPRALLYAHRWSYEHFRGPIPEGLVIDHLCRNPGCVNPDHLEPVTSSENVRRGIGPERTRDRCAQITECKHGHSFTPENTQHDARGRRVCRSCRRIKTRIKRGWPADKAYGSAEALSRTQDESTGRIQWVTS